LDLPYVVALGEVRLDRTVPVKLWRRQEEVLRQVLTLARKDRVIVLHLRGTFRSNQLGIVTLFFCILSGHDLNCQNVIFSSPERLSGELLS
jgi:predicted metal-dependent TIM-barrel fold hydrolase